MRVRSRSGPASHLGDGVICGKFEGHGVLLGTLKFEDFPSNLVLDKRFLICSPLLSSPDAFLSRELSHSPR